MRTLYIITIALAFAATTPATAAGVTTYDAQQTMGTAEPVPALPPEPKKHPIKDWFSRGLTGIGASVAKGAAQGAAQGTTETLTGKVKNIVGGHENPSR